MSADSPIMSQWPDEEQQDSKTYALSGKIMLISMITLFVVVVCLVLLHLYARWYLLRLHRRANTPRNRPIRVVYYVDNNRPSSTAGLEPSVLKSLPLFVYSSETDTNMPECAVCLSEFENGEKGRVLPNCKHTFHIGCIDMWFHSNSTCPLCRSPVEPMETEMTVLVEPGSTTPPSTPVQQVAELTETTSSSAGQRKRIDVRIDVPDRSEPVAENEFRLPSPGQGLRSPGSRLLSLKRIMNMGRKSPVVSPSSGGGPSSFPVATELDIESDQESSRPG